MNANMLAVIFTATVMFGAARSSPVYPVIPLNAMLPNHACVFACNICYYGSSMEKMLQCANGCNGLVTFPPTPDQCPNYKDLERFMGEKQ